MNNEFHKPYIDELYGKTAQKRHFVYPREVLTEEPIFPYYVLDGGAFFFMTDHFGDATSYTLLKKTLSGELFNVLRDKDGNIDWGIAYNTSEKTGVRKRHELQSWPQRLYMLLPLAQEYMKTGDKKFSDAWMKILRHWVENGPYEPFNPDIMHTNTTMKWRDMQVSWRTMTLIHSVYLLGTKHAEEAFTKDEWKFIYDFIDLNLSHLVLEAKHAIATNRYGNHVLQIGSALVSGGILFSELPRAEEYLENGRDVVLFCHKNAIFEDGGSNESSPSYSHFIARLYLEAEKHCELNGYPEIPGIHDSIIRQYQWLATCARKNGKNLRTSDSYSIDSHADVERMAKIFPFTPNFEKKSVCLKDSGFILLRNDNFELAFDAMNWYGGHQHLGRMQPLLWVGDEDILVDTGCCSYDYLNAYIWTMTEEAHSVIYCPDIPARKAYRRVDLLDFSEENNSVSSKLTVMFEDISYEWTRTLVLTDSCLDVTDTVCASKEMNFKGHWYLGKRATQLSVDKLSAKQLLEAGVLDITSDLMLKEDRTATMNDNNQPDWLERLTWAHTGKEFTVHTKFEIKKY